MWTWWKNYGLETCFYITVLFLVFIGCKNVLTGDTKGTYDPEHVSRIKRLWFKPGPSSSSSSSSQGPKSEFVSRGEAECRRVLEQETGLPFPKQRPKFLFNDVVNTGQALELDAYNADLKLAVEYQGIHHYQFVPFFHKTREAYHTLRYRDDLKARLCRENGVRLLLVPYSVRFSDIEKKIKGFLKNGT